MDECESDKVLAGEVEVRREGKVRWGARWTTVSRTDFEAVKWRFRKRVWSGEVIVNKRASDRVGKAEGRREGQFGDVSS